MDTSEALKTRYADAYGVANTVTTIGAFLKFCGGAVIIVALIVAVNVGGTTSGGMFGPPQSNAGAGFALFALGAILVIFVISFGFFISAHGQMLKANLDSAVNGSPFLNNQQRAEIMGIPVSAGAQVA